MNFNNIDVYIIPMNNKVLALKIANELRKNKINVEIDMNDFKLKKALGIVNEKNIPVVIILGDDEINQNKIAIKDMKNKTQVLENMDGYVNKVKEIIKI